MTARLSQSGMGRVLALAAGSGLLFAVYREGVSAYAESLSDHSPAGLAEVAALTPGNAGIWRDRGRAAMEAGDGDAAGYFREAIALNPADSQAHIGLGLLAEAAGRLTEAEQHFVLAAANSRRFRPQFALAYFYARQAPLEKFWPAAIRAAAVEGADLRPLFAVIHSTVPKSEIIARDLRLTTQHSLAAYTQFLLEMAGSPGLADIALRIEPVPARRKLLMASVERLLEQSLTASALRVWNRLYPDSLDPGAGRSVTNSDFTPGDGAGFDWRHANVAGIQLRQAPGSLRVEFSGRQPEDAVLIEQWVPVLPDRKYQLRWTATLSGPAIRPGVHWRINARRSASIVSAEGGQQETAGFMAGPGENLVRLALCYSRPPGATRIEGVLDVQAVELRLQ